MRPERTIYKVTLINIDEKAHNNCGNRIFTLSYRSSEGIFSFPALNIMTQKGEVIMRFQDVSFEHNVHKPILKEVSFTTRLGSKIALMGQNGAGKSTLFELITGGETPDDGNIHLAKDLSIAIARQVIPREELELTVRDFFQKAFKEKVYNIDPRIDEVLEVVNLHAPKDKLIKDFLKNLRLPWNS